MAKKEKTDYAAERQALLSGPPGRLYLLWGEEDYLRESYFAELRGLVFPDGDSGGMSHRRIDGQASAEAVRDAVLTLPFFSERSLVELRGFNPNKCLKSDAARLTELFADMPDYCTLALLPDAGFEPDGRLGFIKDIKKRGKAIDFTSPNAPQLITWIRRRFEAGGKKISKGAAEHLLFMCSPLMNRLRPEIDKLTSYAAGQEITVDDINKVVDRLPETRVFELTDHLAQRDFEGAASSLAELFAMREQPIAMLAMIGTQFRRLYAARLALDKKLGEAYVREVTGIKYDFLIKKLMSSARDFDIDDLRAAVARCADCDFRLKSSSGDGEDVLTELLLSLAVRA